MNTISAFLVFLFMFCANDSCKNELSYRLTLKALDHSGNNHSIVFGIDPEATYGYDKSLGEAPIPPSPPLGIFDFRFKDIPGKRRIPSEGTYTDIREATNKAQCDTFVVYCQASNNSYPLTITLEGNANKWCDSIIVETTLNNTGYRLNMLKKKQFIVYSEDQSTQKIIVYTKPINKN
jgi:hypothetical protein